MMLISQFLRHPIFRWGSHLLIQSSLQSLAYCFFYRLICLFLGRLEFHFCLSGFLSHFPRFFSWICEILVLLAIFLAQNNLLQIHFFFLDDPLKVIFQLNFYQTENYRKINKEIVEWREMSVTVSQTNFYFYRVRRRDFFGLIQRSADCGFLFYL